MHARLMPLLAAALATVLLAVATGSASANRFSVNELNFRFVYLPIDFLSSSSRTIRCPVTLEGSFHSRTSSKVAGALAGFITRASMGTCESGRARFNTETLPWHVQYGSFTGLLPNIESITMYTIRPSWEIEGAIFGLIATCRYTSPRQGAVNTRELRGAITTHRPSGERISSETINCPEGRLEGIARVTTPTGGNIVVTLI